MSDEIYKAKKWFGNWLWNSKDTKSDGMPWCDERVHDVAMALTDYAKEWQSEAVKHGVATYYLDEKNNKCWKWNNVGRD